MIRPKLVDDIMQSRIPIPFWYSREREDALMEYIFSLEAEIDRQSDTIYNLHKTMERME